MKPMIFFTAMLILFTAAGGLYSDNYVDEVHYLFLVTSGNFSFQ